MTISFENTLKLGAKRVILWLTLWHVVWIYREETEENTKTLPDKNVDLNQTINYPPNTLSINA